MAVATLVPVEIWSGCDLLQYDDIVDRLLQSSAATASTFNSNHTGYDISTGSTSDTTVNGTTLALVGIHLCNHLTPTLISIANMLGPIKCPFLLVAPCCLPRVVRSAARNADNINANNNNNHVDKDYTLHIYQYETPNQRLARVLRFRHRQEQLASNRNKKGNIQQQSSNISCCLYCHDIGHNLRSCPMLPCATIQSQIVTRGGQSISAVLAVWLTWSHSSNVYDCRKGSN